LFCFFIQELIKTTASAQQITTTTNDKEFKVVVITDVDHLTKDAQHALRRTMEKYMTTCRIILCANSTSKVIPAIQSRCLLVRIPAPTELEIIGVLQNIAKKENCQLPLELAERIAEKSNRNLRRAILLTEACRVAQYPFTDDQSVMDLD
jgi:replication factor C subunit 3/5